MRKRISENIEKAEDELRDRYDKRYEGDWRDEESRVQSAKDAEAGAQTENKEK